jgi:CMP-N-acetylneuraminic acid synthetase
MEMNILAIIPARGGSKGIPHKNIRPFNGKPLIAHSIEAGLGAPSVGRVIVSTDDAEIAAIAKQYGADVPFLRPAELAEDKSKVVDAIVHAMEKLRADEGYEPTHLLLLQPTNPLRTSDDIERAVELFTRRSADSLVSVCRTENLLLTKDAEDQLTILNTDQLKTSNRQELTAFYKLDGCMIYLVDAKRFLAEKSFFAGKLVGYEIERWRAVDLDDPQDFVLGEMIQREQEHIRNAIKNFS